LLAAEGLEETVIAGRLDAARARCLGGGRGLLGEGITGWRTGSAVAGRTSYHPAMKTSGITAALSAQDLGRAKAFYVEKVGLQALESAFLKARDGQVGGASRSEMASASCSSIPPRPGRQGSSRRPSSM
jgi:hypothetical protein